MKKGNQGRKEGREEIKECMLYPSLPNFSAPNGPVQVPSPGAGSVRKGMGRRSSQILLSQHTNRPDYLGQTGGVRELGAGGAAGGRIGEWSGELRPQLEVACVYLCGKLYVHNNRAR